MRTPSSTAHACRLSYFVTVYRVKPCVNCVGCMCRAQVLSRSLPTRRFRQSQTMGSKSKAIATGNPAIGVVVSCKAMPLELQTGHTVLYATQRTLWRRHQGTINL